jgi:hypothetical protein
MKENLLIESLTAPCPVQAEGTIDGNRFYFRARWDSWSFAVSENSELDPVLIDTPEHGFYIEQKYGNNPYDAGYMPVEEAKTIIQQCAEIYLNERSKYL